MNIENSLIGTDIPAILLAAGLSTRMGQPKLLLPWGKNTVLGKVVSTFAEAGVKDLVVITGGARERVEEIVAGLAGKFPVRAVFNPEFERGEMLSSIKTGLSAMSAQAHAALVGLGDQPQVREETIRNLCSAFASSHSPLIIPSFQNQRGHPWLAARSIWAKILALPSSTTARDFLNGYTGNLEYISADQSILQDLDTPSDYTRQRP